MVALEMRGIEKVEMAAGELSAVGWQELRSVLILV